MSRSDKDLTAAATPDESFSNTADLNKGLDAIAELRLTNFKDGRRRYYEIRSQIFGPPKSETWSTQLERKTKLRELMVRLVKTRAGLREGDYQAEVLRQATVKVSILDRAVFLTNPNLKVLVEIEENKKTLQAFMEMELYKEVNCERFLMLQGLTPAQFHFLIKKMGADPWAFLSDPRGENAGRVVIGNALLVDGRHPLAALQCDDPDYAKELALWQPVFPKLGHIPWVRDWRMSRTHGVVYGLKDEQEKDVLMFPVHIDPKSPMALVKDVFGKKKGERPAIAYHQIAREEEARKSEYVGTGLYDLGCKNFIRLLKQANKNGLFANLIIDGADTLKTTGTIVGDDRITWQIAEKGC